MQKSSTSRWTLDRILCSAVVCRLTTWGLLGLVALSGQGCLVWRYPVTPDVAGYVNDATTTKPIAGATVSMRREEAGGSTRVEVVRTSATSGAFHLPARHVWRPCFLIPGDYWPAGTLVVEAPGYRIYEQRLETFGGGKLRLPNPVDLVPEDSVSSNVRPRPEPPKFTLPQAARPDSALLYILRPNHPPLAYKSGIVVNGVTVARLGTRAYVALELPPGPYTVQAHWSWLSGVPDSQVALQAEKGRTYCLMVHTSMTPSNLAPDTAPVYRFHSSIELLREDVAPAKLAQCRPVKIIPGVDSLIRPH